VNVATLYRHFPAKDDLVAAVLDEVLEPIASARDRALATEATGEALAVFIHEAVRLQTKHRGLVDAMVHRRSGSEVRARLREPAIEIVTPLVERAHRDGELRADFGVTDVLVALRMVAVVAIESQDAARYVDVILRGLRPD
jgi:AcrR family transcriptional regulator